MPQHHRFLFQTALSKFFEPTDARPGDNNSLNQTKPWASKTFQAIYEDQPGEQWLSLYQRYWPGYKKWFLSQGDAARPGYGECLKQFKAHMPELLPTWEKLVELAGGADSSARFLSLYCPPPYLSGCTQAVWTGDQPVLVRNYDYSAARLEGSLLCSRWNGRTVISMSDALWGVLDGINDSGLSVSLAFGGRLNVGKGFGIPIILRYILEFCDTTREAIEVLKRVPTHMSYNITLIDRTQSFATVYVAPEKPAVVRQVPVATNHQGRIEWPRHAWATATIEREMAIQQILSDIDETEQGLIQGFLQPPVFNDAYQRGFGTLYTAVYRPLQASVDIIWPQQHWHQSIHQFEPATTTIQYTTIS